MRAGICPRRAFFLLFSMFFLFGCGRVVRRESEFRFVNGSPFTVVTNFRAHAGYVSYGVFSSDGSYLATGSADKTAKVWNTTNWRAVFVLREDYPQVWGVPLVFDRGDSYLVYGAYDTLKVFDLAGRSNRTSRRHTSKIRTIKQGGEWVVTGDSAGSIHLWSVPDLNLVREKKTSAREIWSVSVDERRGIVAAGGENGRVYTFTFPELLPIHTGGEHFLPVEHVLFSPSGAVFATAGSDGVIMMRNNRTSAVTGTLRGHVGAVLSLAFLDDVHLVSGGEDDTILFWDWKEGRIVGMEYLDSDVMTLHYNPATKRLFVGTRNGYIYIWEIQP